MTVPTQRFDWERAVLASDLPGPARLVALVLAVRVNPDLSIPAEFSPSLTRLAKDSGQGRSTTARALNRLEADGWVVRDRPETEAAIRSHERTRYRLGIPSTESRSGTGVVPERDGVEGTQSRSGTGGSPALGRGVVPERDTTSTSSITSSISSVVTSVVGEQEEEKNEKNEDATEDVTKRWTWEDETYARKRNPALTVADLDTIADLAESVSERKPGPGVPSPWEAAVMTFEFRRARPSLDTIAAVRGAHYA